MKRKALDELSREEQMLGRMYFAVEHIFLKSIARYQAEVYMAYFYKISSAKLNSLEIKQKLKLNLSFERQNILFEKKNCFI